MKLFLARHGNTFGPDDKIVWIGKHNDLSLVKKGVEQAENVAHYFSENNISPKAIFVSPLQRTQKFAEKIIETLNLSLTPTVDERLNEIDYGDWSGLNNAEIEANFGGQKLEAWNNFSVWPQDAGWGGNESDIREAVKDFSNELKNNFDANEVLVISSNGILRYFLSLIPNEFEKRVKQNDFKMGTGNVSKMKFNQDSISLDFWNKKP